jgi:hypothetical protein
MTDGDHAQPALAGYLVEFEIDIPLDDAGCADVGRRTAAEAASGGTSRSPRWWPPQRPGAGRRTTGRPDAAPGRCAG